MVFDLHINAYKLSINTPVFTSCSPSVRLSVVLGPLLASLAGAGARREDQVMPRRGRQTGVMTEDMVNIKMLNISVPGVPGQDFPILAKVPDTSFRSSAFSL